MSGELVVRSVDIDRNRIDDRNATEGSALDSAEPFFGPAIMLPDQFGEQVSGGSRHHAEKRLMAAVLQDAVAIFRRHVHTERGPGVRMFQEAQQWFRSNDTSWPFSFESICNALDISPLYLRRALELWRRGLRDSLESRYARKESGNRALIDVAAGMSEDVAR